MINKYGTPLAIIILMISLLAFSYMLRKPVCIDSRVVYKINRFEGKENHTILRCSQHQSLGFDSGLFDLMPTINKKINKIETVLESIFPFSEPISIEINSDSKNEFKLVGNAIKLSENMVTENLVLEKAITQLWLIQLSPYAMNNESLIWQGFSDLILYVAGLEPLHHEPIEWPFVLKNFSHYCKSKNKILEHYQLCSENIKSQEIVTFSMRPLYSMALINSYLSLSAKEKNEFLKELPDHLFLIKNDNKILGITSFDENMQRYAELSLFLENSIKLLPLHGEVSKKFVSRVKNEIDQKGFYFDSGISRVNNLIVYKEPVLDSTLSHLLGLGLSTSTILKTNEEIYLLPSVDPIFDGSIGLIQSKKIVYVVCEWPSYQEILDFHKHSSKIYVIKDCDQSTNVGPLLTQNLETFADKNLNTQFIEIHLPSFEFAIKKANLNKNTRLDLADKKFLATLGWSTPHKKQFSSYFISNTQIEAVQSFRLNNPLIKSEPL